MKGSIPVLLVVSFILIIVPIQAGTIDEVYHLVCVDASSGEIRSKLLQLNLDILEIGSNGTMTLCALEPDLGLLDQAGIEYEILIRDLELQLAERLWADPKVGGKDWPDGSMGGYYTNSEIETMLDDWAVQYPNIITPKMSIGTSIEGRDIWAVKISDNPNIDEDEPEISYDTLIHPREMMGLMTALWYVKHLLEGYGTDPEMTHLVNNREIWFIPVHNPDAHIYNQQTNPTGGGMWRKNRRHNGGGVYGVDLARNYGFKWGYDNIGSSPDPTKISYRGTVPFSEPEAQAVRDFILSRPIVTSWNTHTFTNVYICPFAYDDVLPYGNDWPLYQEYLRDIAIENGYPGGPSPDTLGYYANGCPLDWQYGEAGVLCLAPEIGTWDDFFWPPKSRIVPLAEENFLAISYWSWIAGSFVALHEHVFDDAYPDGFYHPGETVELILTLRNKGQAGTATDVTATISTTDPYVTILNDTYNFGVMNSVTNVDNANHPMKFRVDSKTPYGEVLEIDVAITFDGYTKTETLSLVCGVPHILHTTDMEAHPGWTVGDTGDNATSGIWERNNPVGTAYGTLQVQPEDDHTPAPGTMCYVTGNGSMDPDGDDVDNGKTTLKTAVFDLAGEDDALISYWRWYADLGPFFSNNDLFVVDISNDAGATWVNLETLDHTINYWQEATFRVSDFLTPTNLMMLRFIARDEPDDSYCEACIDDFTVKTYSLPLALSLIGTPAIGSTVNIEIDSPKDAGLGYFMAASILTFPVFPVGDRAFPLGYDFLLTPLSITPGNGIFNNFVGYLDGAGYSAAPEFVIPYKPILVGRDIFFAAATIDAAYPEGIKHISAPLHITVQ